jgi:hemophore-related protein
MQSTKVAVVLGGMALSLTIGVGAGVASAAPDLGPLVNTTCSYPQVVAALNAQSPEAANEFNAQPIAQSMLSNFIASPVDQRQQIAEQVLATPIGQQYALDVQQVASTCNHY